MTLDGNKIEPTVDEMMQDKINTSFVVRNKQKMEFSKKILIIASIINIVVVGITLYIVIRTYNVQPLSYLVPSVAAEVSAGTIFYYRKSQLENMCKILTSYNVPLSAEVIGKILNR